MWSNLDASGIVNVTVGLLVSSEVADGCRSKVVGYDEVSPGRVFGSVCVANALRWYLVDWWWNRGWIDPSKLRGESRYGLAKSPRKILGKLPGAIISWCAALSKSLVLAPFFVLCTDPCHPYRLVTIRAVEYPLSMRYMSTPLAVWRRPARQFVMRDFRIVFLRLR